MRHYFNKAKKVTLSMVLLGGTLLLVTLALMRPATRDVQKVIQSIPNESLLGLSKLLNIEQEKSQDILLQKLYKFNEEYMASQERRFAKLEKLNEELISEVRYLKNHNSNPNLSLREKLIALRSYEVSGKFPAYIWQSWKHGLNDDRFGEAFRQGESQWAYKNPGFVHEIFNDDTAHAVVKHLYSGIPEIPKAYGLLPDIVLKMDFFRYLILFAKGGLWADIDTYPLQPIPNWIPENVSPQELGMIIGIEVDSNSKEWKKEQARRLQFGQFIIQSKPGHPILREIIAEITEKTLKLQKRPEEIPNDIKLVGSPNQRYIKILKWTGSGIWTDVVLKFFNNYIQSSIYQQITWKEFHALTIPKLVSDVLVLPVSSFASELPIPKDGKVTDPLAFAKHSVAQLWKSSNN